MGRVTHAHGSCDTYAWVMSHIWRSHVTHMNESCHTYEWVMSHIWMSHVTHMNESCHTYEWVVWHIYKHGCDTLCDTVLLHILIISHVTLWHTLHAWLDSFICVTLPIHMCDRTYSYVTHDPLKHMAWLSQTYVIYVWHTTSLWHSVSHVCDTRLTASCHRDVKRMAWLSQT